MSLREAIQGAVASAFTAVDDIAENVPYHSVGIINYDPNAGINIEEGGYDYQVWAIKLEYSQDKVDNETILPTDYEVMLKGQNIEFTPKVDDTLEIARVVYRVINPVVDPAGATWTLQVRPFHEDTITTI